MITYIHGNSMSLYIDLKYLKGLSHRLEMFKDRGNHLYNCRCSICGDSQRNKRKARGYFYRKKNDMFYKCHNCSVSQSFGTFLKNFDSELEVLFFDHEDLTDVEVWSLMRHFSGYIIANSSFSWWGAFLRMDKSAPVCVPKPWFKGMRDPNLLIPADWIQVEST